MPPTLKREAYPQDSATWPAFINAADIEGLFVDGKDNGIIEFNGDDWWSCKHCGCWCPGGITFFNISSLHVHDLSLHNPADHFFRNCKNTHVVLERLNISAPHTSPNTDEINFYGVFDLFLRDSVISNGDDCVAVQLPGDYPE